ncbi:MAG: NAD-dependent epimerase/dehydratase family protein [Candidatus Bathyarchaeia archaeon]
MDVLVTGTGFVGANVVAKFIDEGNSVIALDPNPVKPDYLEGAGNKLKMFKGSVTELQPLEEVVKKEKPRILVHTATYLNPKEVYNVFEVNVRGTSNALELSRRNDLRLVYLSSGAIYGQMEGTRDIDEDEPFGPLYPPREHDNTSGVGYAMSKRLGEQWVGMYRDLYGLEVTSLRLGWVYGRGIADYRLNSGVSLFLRKAMVGESMHLPYGGDTFCDFVHVFDVADVIFNAATKPIPKSLAFNITYEKGYWMKEVASALKNVIPNADITLGPGMWPSKGVPIPRGGISFPSARHTDITRAKRELGYAPSYDIVKGMNEYLAWMKKNWNLCSPQKYPFPA